jgi:magnesium transporter
VFRVVDLGPDGKLTVRENIEDVSRPDEGTLRWVDLRGQDKGLERLRAEFAFHPLAIEDCKVFDQRPKLEEYRDHLFLVTQSFADTGQDGPAAPSKPGRARSSTPPTIEHAGLELYELHAFLGKDYLVRRAEVEANGFTTVPEPAALSLIALAAIGTLRRARRRR